MKELKKITTGGDKVKPKAVSNKTAYLICHYVSSPSWNKWWLLGQVQLLTTKLDTSRRKKYYVRFENYG